MILLEDDVPGLLPIGQVSFKSLLPSKKIYLSRTTRRHFLGALYTDSTLQVVTISVAMAPRILKLATWFVYSLPKPKDLCAKCQPSKNFNLEGCWFHF